MKMLKPENEAALAEAVAGANGPLKVIGGGTRDIGRPIEGAVLSAAALSGVSLYEPGALTVVCGAGTPMQDLQDALATEGQRLAFEPMDHRVLLGTKGAPTIGGAIAANVSGPRRINVGAARDFLLGVRFVDGQGRILKNGGRVMKNVTGYDLVKLMAGSWGTLGVLSEVSLKVLARPETEATLVARGQGAAQAVLALSAALGSPFDVTGAAWAETADETLVRIEGLEASVAYRAAQLQARLDGDWDVLEADDSRARWAEVRDVTCFAAKPGAVWRVSVKPSDGPVLLDRLKAAGVVHEALLDWGGGLLWLLVPEAAEASAQTLRGEVALLGGHATLVRAVAATRAQVPAFQPEQPGVAQLTKTLRARFDPRGILNPGLMD